ncbi:FTR1 family protein [Porticoccaceae bacterium LTM1]|nr:FTR1 family protein [Porticoccaceae bacterium LTM1]
MMLTAVIIVLREALEAALLTSVLLALSRLLMLSYRWFALSLLLGIVGACIYALNMSSVSEWFDYRGQELVNGLLQLFSFLSAVMVVIFVGLFGNQSLLKNWPIKLVLAITMMMAVIREGAEIFIYVQGFLGDSEKFGSVLTGGLVGAAIGASIGAILYYSLAFNNSQRAILWCQLVLAVVATGILSQVVPLFEQVDILPSTERLWDSSLFIDEQSLLGQLLYAIVGYEATPSLYQLVVYIAGIAAFVAALVIFQKRVR